MYTYTFFKSNFKLGESDHFGSCIWPMGYSFIHSLSKVNIEIKLWSSLSSWRPSKSEQMQLVVFWGLRKLCPESFKVGTFFSIPVLTFHCMETSY